MSGGQAGAENGQLTVMCGSDDEAVYERPVPVIAAYAKSCVRLGDAGAGQLTKMVNQICIAGLVQGLAEGVNFAQRAGLDVDQVVEVIGKGAAQSWQMDNRAPTMAAGQFDFGFAVDWMRKDLGIVLDEASGTVRAPDHRARRSVLRAGPAAGRRAVGHLVADRSAHEPLTLPVDPVSAARDVAMMSR